MFTALLSFSFIICLSIASPILLSTYYQKHPDHSVAVLAITSCTYRVDRPSSAWSAINYQLYLQVDTPSSAWLTDVSGHAFPHLAIMFQFVRTPFCAMTNAVKNLLYNCFPQIYSIVRTFSSFSHFIMLLGYLLLLRILSQTCCSHIGYAFYDILLLFYFCRLCL